jgi:hypothetical protein
MRKVAAALVLLVFAAGAAKLYVPFLTTHGPEVNSTPSLEGITPSEIKVRAGQDACIAPVPLDPSDRRLHMLLRAHGKRAPVVDVTVTQPGYTARARFHDYAVGGATPVESDLSQAPPRALDGQLCLRNRGPRAVWLVGTAEGESLTLPVTSVDGTVVADIDPAITFFTGGHTSLVQRLSRVVHRAADFTGVLPAWLLWPLGLLFFLGLPFGAAAALLLADRADPVSAAPPAPRARTLPGPRAGPGRSPPR